MLLGDDEARRRRVQKSILERAAPPAFDVAIEMVERDTWRVHHDLAEAVDVILAGGTAYGEIRSRLASGEIKVEKGGPPMPKLLPVPARTRQQTSQASWTQFSQSLGR